MLAEYLFNVRISFNRLKNVNNFDLIIKYVLQLINQATTSRV